MDSATIIRAWKDHEFRASLPPEQRAEFPENPSGTPLTELDEGDLDDIMGGCRDPSEAITYPVCPSMGPRCTTGGSITFA